MGGGGEGGRRLSTCANLAIISLDTGGLIHFHSTTLFLQHSTSDDPLYLPFAVHYPATVFLPSTFFLNAHLFLDTDFEVLGVSILLYFLATSFCFKIIGFKFK